MQKSEVRSQNVGNRAWAGPAANSKRLMITHVGADCIGPRRCKRRRGTRKPTANADPKPGHQRGAAARATHHRASSDVAISPTRAVGHGRSMALPRARLPRRCGHRWDVVRTTAPRNDEEMEPRKLQSAHAKPHRVVIATRWNRASYVLPMQNDTASSLRGAAARATHHRASSDVAISPTRAVGHSRSMALPRARLPRRCATDFTFSLPPLLAMTPRWGLCPGTPALL